MSKIICIVGSTATGKTQKAIDLSLGKMSIIVSADSRQVYRGMDIVPGKDHDQNIQIHGIDLVDPDEPSSVSLWYDAVVPTIKNAISNDIQVIVVGGTGLYVKALLSGIETMNVPINASLRRSLEGEEVVVLQDKLRKLDNTKFDSLNHSDLFNKRRLIRAIEVALSPIAQTKDLQKFDAEIHALRYANKHNQESQIHKRVLARLDLGAVDETKRLLAKYDPSLQSMTAIGYRSIIAYLQSELTYDQMIANWVHDEMSYVKRQNTWFHKMKVIWYDVDTEGK